MSKSSTEESMDECIQSFFRKISFQPQSKVLDVSPTREQLSFFPEVFSPAKYTAIGKNIQSSKVRVLNMDATRMSFSDHCFDVILCNQVLSYIRSDYQAMSEAHRCLKANGFAMMNSTVLLSKTQKASDFFMENPKINPNPNLEWVYGEDYYERLEAAGFFVHRASHLNRELILCFKYKDAREKFIEAHL